MSRAGMVSFTVPEIKELSQRALMRAGLSADDAVVVTEVYLEAELWGRKTHGFRPAAIPDERSVACDRTGDSEHLPAIRWQPVPHPWAQGSVRTPSF